MDLARAVKILERLACGGEYVYREDEAVRIVLAEMQRLKEESLAQKEELNRLRKEIVQDYRGEIVRG